MEHQQSKVKVYQSENYKMFKRIDGNRKTSAKKKERIIKEIQSGNDILDESPILVKENKHVLYILDGQNRFEIAEELKRPVHYIIKKDDMSIYNVAKVNSNVEKWKFSDFINSYIASGNENYKKIQKFHDTYGIAIGTCLVMLTYGTIISDSSMESLNQKFQMGEFEVKKYKEACQVAEICKTFSEYDKWNSRPFVTAISRILIAEKCDFDVLVKKFKRDPSRLKYHSHWKGFANNLQEIYNIDNSKQRVIY
jgi:hypothetical protein